MEVEEEEFGGLFGGSRRTQITRGPNFAFDETPSFFDLRKRGQKQQANDFTPFDVTTSINPDTGVDASFGIKNRFKAHRYGSMDSEKSIFKSDKQLYIGERSNELESDKENSSFLAKTFVPNRSLLRTTQTRSTLSKTEILNKKATHILGYDVHISSEAKDDTTWVTIFGFDHKLTQFIIDYFLQYGDVEDMKTFKNANFLFLKFKTKEAAIGALSQNGSLLRLGGYNLFIGVKSGMEGETVLNSLVESLQKVKRMPKGKIQQMTKPIASFNVFDINDWLNICYKIAQWIFLGK